jgi:hypothetical protein
MIHAKIAYDPEVEQRGEFRLTVPTDVSLRVDGAQWEDARLVNISSRGFMAEAAAGVSPGSSIWLLLPGVGRVNAQVIWVRGERLGGAFADAIDPLRVLQAVGEEAGR